MAFKITQEQQAIIQHPIGQHARVLAVAGSGKTTTLAYRIQYLIVEQDESPSNILVLMFNRLARQQFQARLTAIGLSPHLHPKIYTFHAFAFRFINAMMKSGHLPLYTELWVEDRSELAHIYLLRAIENLEKRGVFPLLSVSAKRAMEIIGLWKGSLIPPHRAGYHGLEPLPAVYGEFEKLRTQRKALTFDDFVPTAVELLEANDTLRERWCERVNHLIVDEYQDVNFGQQRLLELLAGQKANMMVVGDDDQTIYEWRGARPNYIIQEFKTIFNNRPQVDYYLSRSFRFGPILSQSALNTIRLNQHRVKKDVIAHAIGQPADIVLYQAEPGNSTDSTREMVNQILMLVTQRNVTPANISILCRLYTQLSLIEIECLHREVPYRVIGQQPFFDRQENLTLRHYFRVAQLLNKTVSTASTKKLLNIANRPSRYLSRRLLEQALDGGRMYQLTLHDALFSLIDNQESPLNRLQRISLQELHQLLLRIRERIAQETTWSAGKAFQWLVETLNYLSYFDNYYGPGETSFDRQQSVNAFINYAQYSGLSLTAFLDFLDTSDTTQGEPADRQLIMTSVHRTKGLEWDYVFIPQLKEGFMPYLGSTEVSIYDKAGIVEMLAQSPALESERRLFYVALTRARKEVHIEVPLYSKHTDILPSRFLEEIQVSVTRDTLGVVQKLAANPFMDTNLLLQALQWHGSYRHIIDPLTTYYLRELDQTDLITQVEALVTKTEFATFAYQLDYKAPSDTVDKLTKKSERAQDSAVWQKLANKVVGDLQKGSVQQKQTVPEASTRNTKPLPKALSGADATPPSKALASADKTPEPTDPINKITRFLRKFLDRGS